MTTNQESTVWVQTNISSCKYYQSDSYTSFIITNNYCKQQVEKIESSENSEEASAQWLDQHYIDMIPQLPGVTTVSTVHSVTERLQASYLVQCWVNYFSKVIQLLITNCIFHL